VVEIETSNKEEVGMRRVIKVTDIRAMVTASAQVDSLVELPTSSRKSNMRTTTNLGYGVTAQMSTSQETNNEEGIQMDSSTKGIHQTWIMSHHLILSRPDCVLVDRSSSALVFVQVPRREFMEAVSRDVEIDVNKAANKVSKVEDSLEMVQKHLVPTTSASNKVNMINIRLNP